MKELTKSMISFSLALSLAGLRGASAVANRLLGNCFSSSDFLERHGPGKVGVQLEGVDFSV
jgi:hypothetical protein